MDLVLTVKILIFALLVFIIYIPEILPRCDCCHKIKLRGKFKFHVQTKMTLTRKGKLSLCKTCCEKENFTSVSKYCHYKETKKKTKAIAGWKL
ncbi:MAG: hypothetical protein E7388_04665 [Ruminococcaceae bacterium]|nr:hypothetical protein [Oscillospiraceae bacterium]